MKYGEINLSSSTPLRYAVKWMRRLKHLHERPVLLGAGVVTERGSLVKGDRVEEPMSREAYRASTARLIEQMGGLHLKGGKT